jgi:hypothetical protein
VLSSRACYRAVALGPLIGLAIAAALATPAALPAGWDWVYPTSVTRGLLVYSVLAAWLWIEIGRRPAAEIRRRMWWVPLLYVAFGWLLMFGLALVRGAVAELWAEHAGAIATRTAVHLLIGYGYVALIHVALNRLPAGPGTAEAP